MRPTRWQCSIPGKSAHALGLHVTLTAPFKPLSEDFAPLRDGCFLPLNEMMRAGMTRALAARSGWWSRSPRRCASLSTPSASRPISSTAISTCICSRRCATPCSKVVAQAAPGAWVRQCGRARGARGLRERKALVLDILSQGFRRKARQLGIATNPAFAGAYDFNAKADFAKTFPRFLTGLPDGGLIMCHPGHVDAALERLDSLTTQREREFAYFNSDEFPRVLAAHGVALAQPGRSET